MVTQVVTFLAQCQWESPNTSYELGKTDWKDLDL